MTRICTKCGIDKPLSEFHMRGTGARHCWCKGCVSDYARAYRAANAEACKARGKAWRIANRDAKAATDKAYYEANKDPEYEAARRLKRQYGLTLDDYDRMLEDQGGLCANPGCFNESPIDRRFDIDHDHACCPGRKSCGKCIRGLLCANCNRALGVLHDDIKRIRGLADYLESFE